MSAIDKYAAELAQGLKTGVSDIARNAAADIGNRYQEILMADATIKPADILPGQHEIVQDAAQQQMDQAMESPEQPQQQPTMDR
jgi:hypothetical protein